MENVWLCRNVETNNGELWGNYPTRRSDVTQSIVISVILFFLQDGNIAEM